MKIRQISALIALFAMPTICTASTQAWLLVFRDGRYSVMHAHDDQLLSIEKCGNYAFYATSPTSIYVVSFDTDSRHGSLAVIDRETRKTTVEWPVLAFPAMQMAGASKDLVVIGTDAFFPSIRYRIDGSIDPNRLGGNFDLVRISLVDGVETAFPLPPLVLNARIARFQNELFVSNGDAGHVFRFRRSTGVLEEVRAGDAALSDEEFPWVDAEKMKTALNANSQGDTAGANFYVDSSAESREIPLVKETATGSQLFLMEPGSLKVLWSSATKPDVVPQSVLSIPNDGVAYLDGRSGSVWIVPRGGEAKELWNLKRLAPGVVAVNSRIISVTH